VQHGLTTFLSADVMHFLGRNISPSGKACLGSGYAYGLGKTLYRLENRRTVAVAIWRQPYD